MVESHRLRPGRSHPTHQRAVRPLQHPLRPRSLRPKLASQDSRYRHLATHPPHRNPLAPHRRQRLDHLAHIHRIQRPPLQPQHLRWHTPHRRTRVHQRFRRRRLSPHRRPQHPPPPRHRPHRPPPHPSHPPHRKNPPPSHRRSFQPHQPRQLLRHHGASLPRRHRNQRHQPTHLPKCRHHSRRRPQRPALRHLHRRRHRPIPRTPNPARPPARVLTAPQILQHL